MCVRPFLFLSNSYYVLVTCQTNEIANDPNKTEVTIIIVEISTFNLVNSSDAILNVNL